MFNDNYRQEYERAVLQAEQLTKELHELLDEMENHEHGHHRYQQDPHFHLFEKHREALERLRHASEHYFGAH